MNENISNLVVKFQKGLLAKREILKELNPFILKTPGYFKYNDNDLKYEFYANIISKIDKILFSYKKINGSSFASWFAVVLNRDFIHFIKKWKNEELINNDYKNLIPNEFYFNEKNIIEVNGKENFDFSILSEKEKRVLAIKFGLTIDDIDVSETINKILEKIEKKKAVENKISLKFIKLVSIQKILSNETDSERINYLKGKESKIKSSKRRFEKIFKRIIILPANRWVADRLGLKEGTIAAYLNKIKDKILKNNADKYLIENN